MTFINNKNKNFKLKFKKRKYKNKVEKNNFNQQKKIVACNSIKKSEQ